MKLTLCLFVLCIANILLTSVNVFSQSPVRNFENVLIDPNQYKSVEKEKSIPSEIRLAALIALSYYPELRDTKIKFRIRNKITPLSLRPKVFSVFQSKKKRAFVLTISKQSNSRLEPILFFNLPFNAQIGVLGHELGHASELQSKNSFQLLKLFLKMTSPAFVDSFEYNTDRICIDHGLGYQLLDWSNYVRNALNIREWKGASELLDKSKIATELNQRYMNPMSIERHISESPLYRSVN